MLRRDKKEHPYQAAAKGTQLGHAGQQRRLWHLRSGVSTEDPSSLNELIGLQINTSLTLKDERSTCIPAWCTFCWCLRQNSFSVLWQAVFQEQEKAFVCSSLDGGTLDECLEKDEEESRGIFDLSCGGKTKQTSARHSNASCHKDAGMVISFWWPSVD